MAEGGCLSRKIHHYMSYRPKWNLDYSQKRLPIKLKNRHGGSQDFKKMGFSAEIGKAIGRSRRTVDNYIADLRAKTQVELDLKIFNMRRLGIPQERIALRLVQTRDVIRDHLGKKAALPKSPNADLKRGFTVPQVAEKRDWAEPLMWSIALEGANYLRILNQSGWQETHIFQVPLSSERFKANVVTAMQKKKIIGVTSRYVIISEKK